MSRASRFLIVLAGVVFSVLPSTRATPSQSVSEDDFAGWIEDVRGPAYLKLDGIAKPTLLDGKRDRYRRLYVGEQVRCDHGAFLRLQLYGTMTEVKESSVWFPIPRVRSPRPDLRQKALESYGRLGGRERRGFSSTFSPADDSVVRAEDLEFRWTPREGIGPVSLIIEDEMGRELWRRENVDGAAGHLTSDDARQALEKYRSGSAQGDLQFIITEPGREETRVVFSLLSAESGRDLDRELTAWDQGTTELMRHVCRAYSYTRRRMYTEAAEEYDAALALGPESRDLLTAAIEAHRRSGNSLRASQLTRMLRDEPSE